MRWVAKAKADLANSVGTSAEFESILARYKMPDILAALRQLRLEAATEAERVKWVGVESKMRSKRGQNETYLQQADPADR